MHEECLVIDPDSPHTPLLYFNTCRPHKNNLKRRTRHWKQSPSLPTKGLRDPMDVVRQTEEVIMHTHCTGYQIITSLRGEVAPVLPLRPTPLYSLLLPKLTQNWISGQLHPPPHLYTPVFLPVNAMNFEQFKHLQWNYSTWALFLIYYKKCLLFGFVSFWFMSTNFFTTNCHLWIYTHCSGTFIGQFRITSVSLMVVLFWTLIFIVILVIVCEYC